MEPERRKSFFARKGWWLLICAVVVYLAGFSLLEKITPAGKGPAGGNAASAPAPPQLRRLDDGAIDVRQGFFHHLTIRTGSDEEDEALFQCLKQGFDEAFGNGTEGMTAAQVRSETERIENSCTDLPGIPRPPSPPRREDG